MSGRPDASFARHLSYNNRFRTSSSGDGGDNSHATTTAATPILTNTPQLASALEDELDVFGHSTQFAKLSRQQSEHEDLPRSSVPPRTATITSQEQPRDCSEITVPFGTNSPGAVSPDSPTNPASNPDNVGPVPVPMAPGKPRRLSRQTSAGAKRQNFAASRSFSDGNNNNSTSVDSTRDDVFVELDVEGAQYLHQQQQPQPRAMFDSSLFPSKKRSEQILSTSSSTAAAALPNPYNHLNHRLHDAVWFCNCLYFVFFCCLPAIHYMEQSDVEFYQLDNQKKASRLGRASTVLFFVGTLLTLLFFSLVFFLAIYFSTG